MLKRRTFIAGTAAAFACGHLIRVAHAQDTPRPGGTLIMSLEPEPSGFLLSSNTAQVLAGQVTDGLVEYDADMKPQPCLAERWEESEDRRTITFHLRKGVKWHDGQPFTSKDVEYSLIEFVKKLNPRAGSALRTLDTVETPDDHTAVLKFSAPSLVFWSVISSLESPMIPRHLFEGTSPITNPWNGKLIGTGAFKFKEWQKGEYILLERNEDYWKAGAPLINRIRIKIITDAGARLAALEAGEVHYSPLSPISHSDVTRLRSSDLLRVETDGYGPFNPLLFMDFNLERPVFQDKRVRAAFAHAIDKQAIVDKVFFGLGRAATGPLPSTLQAFYTKDTTQYDYDPAAAEKLLDEAGLPRGSDGVRVRLNHYPMPYGNTYTRASEYIKEALRQVGVELELHTVDVAQYLRKIFTERDFDTMTCAYVVGADPQFGVFRRFWSKNFEKGVPWSNGSGFSDPEVDKIIDGTFEAADSAERQELINRLQRAAQDHLPSVSLVEMQHFSVVSSAVKGLNTFPDGYSKPLDGVWLDT